MASRAAMNGHGGGEGRLRKLLAHHERLADALRVVLSMMEGEAAATKQQTSRGVLAEALALDQERRAKSEQGGARKHDNESVTARRERTAAFLNRYASGEIVDRSRLGRGIGGLAATGYLARRPSGDYERTDKPFTVDVYQSKKAAKASAVVARTTPGSRKTKADIVAQRAKTGAFLAQFSARDLIEKERVGSFKGFGMLARYGYIRQTAKGWVRTAKPYVVDETAAD